MTYQELVKKWQEYKDLESLANFGRLKIEKDILIHIGGDLREKGVNHLPEGLDITTGFDESWNNNEISKLYFDFENGLLPLPLFPFDEVWKINHQKMALLKAEMPEEVKRVFKNALTIKPKKPSFSIKKNKE